MGCFVVASCFKCRRPRLAPLLLLAPGSCSSGGCPKTSTPSPSSCAHAHCSARVDHHAHILINMHTAAHTPRGVFVRRGHAYWTARCQAITNTSRWRHPVFAFASSPVRSASTKVSVVRVHRPRACVTGTNSDPSIKSINTTLLHLCATLLLPGRGSRHRRSAPA